MQPIGMAPAEPPVGEMVKALGWGKDSDDAPGNVPNLREVDVPVLDDEVAEDYYGSSIDFSTKICIDAEGGKGVCNVRFVL